MKKITTILALMLTFSSAHSQTLDYSKYNNTFLEDFDYPMSTFKTTGLSTGGSTQGHTMKYFWDLQNGDWVVQMNII